MGLLSLCFAAAASEQLTSKLVGRGQVSTAGQLRVEETQRLPQ